ncbi:MAG: hypothetical protein AAF587_01260 [Bacteroidota bacterium]
MPKLILSRKGFDSGSGGKASILLEDQLISLPIPLAGSGIRYDQLSAPDGTAYRTLMDELQIAPFDEAHLDPDIEASVLPNRPGNWQASFGQQGASLTHLRKEGVGIGDLFLFFGWFRQVGITEQGSFSYLPKTPDLHIIYGYLEVGKILNIPTDPIPMWVKKHPHWVMREKMGIRNAIFVAAKHSSFWPGKMGAGTFSYSPKLVLTSRHEDNRKRSTWTLPECFFYPDQSCRLSYHRHKKGRPTLVGNHLQLSSAFRGQEFVCEQTSEIQGWVRSLRN